MTFEDHCLVNNSDWQGVMISFTNVLHCGICKSAAKQHGHYPWRTPMSARKVHQLKSGRNKRVTFCVNFYPDFHSVQPHLAYLVFAGRWWLQNCFIFKEETKKGCIMLDTQFREKLLNYSHSNALILGRHEAITDKLPNH